MVLRKLIESLTENPKCLPQEATHTWRGSSLILKVWNFSDASSNSTVDVNVAACVCPIHLFSLDSTSELVTYCGCMGVAREHMTAGLLLSILPQLRHQALTNVPSEGKHPASRSFTCVSPLCKASCHPFPFVILFLCPSCVSSIHASFLCSGWVASSCFPGRKADPSGQKKNKLAASSAPEICLFGG